MTPAEFIEQALAFQPGRIYVVSGPDPDALSSLLQQARAAIEGAGGMAMVYDSRQTVLYNSNTSILPFRAIWTDSEEALLFEYIAILAENQFVILVSNQFDAAGPLSLYPADLAGSVVYDLFNVNNVSNVIWVGKEDGVGREIFQYISGIYYYDGAEVTYIKSQSPRTTLPSADPYLQITFPAGGESFSRTGEIPVAWQQRDIVSPDIEITAVAWNALTTVVAGKTDNDGYYVWRPLPSLPAGSYQIVLATLGNDPALTSVSGAFTVS